MEYLECKQESLSMWGDQDVWVVYTEKFVSNRHGEEKFTDGKENGYFNSLKPGMP